MSIIMIVEENQEQAWNLQKALMEIQKGLTFTIVPSEKEGIRYIEKSPWEVDTFFVDLDMCNDQGLLFSEKLREKVKYRLTPLILTTATEQDRVELFSKYHCYSVIKKPYEITDLRVQLGHLMEALEPLSADVINTEDSGKKMINIETNEMDAVLSVEDIISMEVLGNNCTIYTRDQKYRLKRGSLERKLEEINDPSIIRCHKSYAVNVRWVKGWKKVERNIWKPVYNSNVAAPCLISKRYFSDVRRHYIHLAGDECAK